MRLASHLIYKLDQVIFDCRKLLQWFCVKYASKNNLRGFTPLQTRFVTGFTLIEILVTIGLMSLVFFALMSVFRNSLVLISESKAKVTANAIALEQLERIKSLDYQSVGTYVISTNCQTYDENNNSCVVGAPPGPIPQQKTERLNSIDYTISNRILYQDDSTDGLGQADENGVITDYKIVETIVSWPNRSGSNSDVRLSTIIAPPGIETSAGGGTARVEVYDAAANPMPGLNILITNDSITPAVYQSSITNATGAALFSGLDSEPGYNLFVNIDEAGQVNDSDYGYDQTYKVELVDDDGDGYVNSNPVLAPVTIDEGLITTLTMIIEPISSATHYSTTIGQEESFSDEYSDQSNVSLSNTEIANSSIRLIYDSRSGTYNSNGSGSTVQLPLTNTVSDWGDLLVEGSAPVNTSVTYQVFGIDQNSQETLISDALIPGNSAGLALNQTVSLNSISSQTYPQLVIKYNLSTTDNAQTPTVDRMQLSYVSDQMSLANVEMQLYGNKIKGTTSGGQEIYKYDVTTTTDSSGVATISPLEADRYNMNVSDLAGYNKLATCPDDSADFRLLPNSEQTITTTWQDDLDTNNVAVITIVNSDNEPVTNTVVTIDHDGIDRTMITNSCGQIVVSDIMGANMVVEFDYLSNPNAETIAITGGAQYEQIIAN